MNVSFTNSVYDHLTSAQHKKMRDRITVAPALPVLHDTQKDNTGRFSHEENRYPSYGTKLVSETQENPSDGTYRRARVFEQADGRRFTKFEEYSLTPQGTRRAVVQENPSGSITRYEEILDRQESGGFRRTQRFQDGIGDVETVITPDFFVTDAFALTNGRERPNFNYLPLFQNNRGTQLDLRA